MIGHDEAGQDVVLDSDKLLGTHLAIIGNTGSGKTHTVRKVLEQLWGKGVQIIIDPEQEFHTLRQLHPYVIVGGPYADMLRPRSAKTLVDWILKTKTSVIIQFDDTEHLDQQREFIASFLNAMMTVPRALWQPAFVVLDEAHRYAPQSGPAGSSRRAICTLMSQGRKRGFTGILCTQRLAKITKDATGECNTWLVGRVGQVLDRNAAANNLGFPLKSDEALGLRDLDPGQFWGFGVALGNKPTLIQVAATASQHLKLGERFTPTPLPEAIKLPYGLSPAGRLRVGYAVASFLIAIVCGLALIPHML
jgi:hypothetical protein